MQMLQRSMVLQYTFTSSTIHHDVGQQLRKQMICFLKLKSKTALLGAVKEQIPIRYLGSGWVKAHHAWSENGNTFPSRRLFNHLLDMVIPLTEE